VIIICKLVIFLLAFSLYAEKEIRVLQAKREKEIALYVLLQNFKKIPIAIPKCGEYIYVRNFL